MADLLDFLPLFEESEEEIRARLDAAVNRGLAITDPDFVDTRQGSIFYDLTQAILLEMARIWDALASEVPAAGFVAYAWGEYLDAHAEALGLDRKAAVAASGTLLFSGVEGTPVAAGQQVSTARTDPEVDPVVFVTTESGVISTTLADPVNLAVTTSGGGYMAPGTYYYVVTAVNQYGETTESNEVTITVAPNAVASLTWDAVSDVTGYRVYRASNPGTETFIKEVPTNSWVDTGVDPETETAIPTVNTTGGKLRVPAQAEIPGAAGNVGADAVTVLASPILDVTGATNEEPMLSGADEENDEDLRERVLLEFQGAGPGTAVDYKRWALAYPGVGRVTVVPVRDGPGTVAVIISDRDGSPVADATVEGLQDQLDPLPGQGAGQAPIGAIVSVETPTAVPITVTAVVNLLPGYSLDGEDSTVAVRSVIESALGAYINKLQPGDDVVFNHVESQFFDVRGVVDVSAVTVNGGAANIPIAEDPPEVARFGTATLTQL